MKKLLLTLAMILALSTLLASCDFVSTTPPENTENGENGGNDAEYIPGVDSVEPQHLHLTYVYNPNDASTCFAWLAGCNICDGGICSEVTEIVVPDYAPDGKKVFAVDFGVFPGKELGKNLTSVTLPNTLEKIGNDDFKGLSSLTSIVIPASVKKIEGNAFNGCTSLASVTFAEGSQLEFISGSPFQATAVTSIELPEGMTKLDGAFDSCTTLKSVVIPSTVTSIGSGTFYGCSALESVVLPSGITAIEWYTFTGCTSLESVVIPEGVTYIGEQAFKGCSALRSIVIPEGVTSIGDSAFIECSSLESIVLPKSLKEIDWGAFTIAQEEVVSAEVYYTGSADDFMKIAVTWGGEVDEESSIADRFDLSAIHYNYVPEN